MLLFVEHIIPGTHIAVLQTVLVVLYEYYSTRYAAVGVSQSDDRIVTAVVGSCCCLWYCS